ncbi:MAG: TetR/AcrR family transcriptional regulator [Candidatus Saccharibacteria bacterium]|nr:TetR/AcrR family transcriptional regulator [Pseudorhodobacter sp.]
MKQDITPRKTGRPLSFQRDAVLERAMRAFWQSGYETTSVSDLTAAMGITAPSLYAAFGDKKQLFLQAMQLYAGDGQAMRTAFAAAPSARSAVRDMLIETARRFTDPATPPGCLLASAAATGSAHAHDIRAAVAAERQKVRQIIEDRIKVDIRLGLLPPDTRADVLSNMAVATVQGLSVMARDGLDRDAVIAVAEAAINGWPKT